MKIKDLADSEFEDIDVKKLKLENQIRLAIQKVKSLYHEGHKLKDERTRIIENNPDVMFCANDPMFYRTINPTGVTQTSKRGNFPVGFDSSGSYHYLKDIPENRMLINRLTVIKKQLNPLQVKINDANTQLSSLRTLETKARTRKI